MPPKRTQASSAADEKASMIAKLNTIQQKVSTTKEAGASPSSPTGLFSDSRSIALSQAQKEALGSHFRDQTRALFDSLSDSRKEELLLYYWRELSRHASNTSPTTSLPSVTANNNKTDAGSGSAKAGNKSRQAATASTSAESVDDNFDDASSSCSSSECDSTSSSCSSDSASSCEDSDCRNEKKDAKEKKKKTQKVIGSPNKTSSSSPKSSPTAAKKKKMPTNINKGDDAPSSQSTFPLLQTIPPTTPSVTVTNAIASRIHYFATLESSIRSLREAEAERDRKSTLYASLMIGSFFVILAVGGSLLLGTDNALKAFALERYEETRSGGSGKKRDVISLKEAFNRVGKFIASSTSSSDNNNVKKEDEGAGEGGTPVDGISAQQQQHGSGGGGIVALDDEEDPSDTTRKTQHVTDNGGLSAEL